MKRSCGWAAALAATAFLATSTAREPRAQDANEPSSAINIEEVLERRFDLIFEEVPLKDVAEHLTELTGVTFYLSQKRLEEASISPDTPLSSAFRNVRLRTWLKIALKEFELTYRELDDLIVITTPEDAENSLVVRVYDCRDLLKFARDNSQASEAAAAQPPKESGQAADAPATGGAAPPGAFGGMGSYCGSVAAPRVKPSSIAAGQLLSVIQDNVQQHSWDVVGGPGTVREFSGFIVVSQTDHVHGDIQRLLEMLREAADLPREQRKFVR